MKKKATFIAVFLMVMWMSACKPNLRVATDARTLRVENSEKFKHISGEYFYSIQTDSFRFSGKEKIESLDEEYLLSIMVSEKPHFLIFYPGNNCSVCFQKDFLRLNDLSSDIEPSNILLISNHMDARELFFFKKRNSIRYAAYSIVNLENKLKTFDRPVYFILNKNEVSKLFIPDPDLGDLTEKYLLYIRDLFRKTSK